MTKDTSRVTSSSSRDSTSPEAWAKRKSPLRTATSGPNTRCTVFRWRRVSASSRMSSCKREAVWMTSIAVERVSTSSLAASWSSRLTGARNMRCTRRQRAGRSRLPPALKTSQMARWSLWLSAALPRASNRRCTSAWSPATHESSDSRSRRSGKGARRSRPRSKSQLISRVLSFSPRPTIGGLRGAGAVPPSVTWRMASSLSRSLRSLLRKRCISARSLRFSTLRSKFRRSRARGCCSREPASASPGWCTSGPSEGVLAGSSRSGRHAMPRVSVIRASFSSPSSKHSRRAAAREPRRLTRPMVRPTPPSRTRRAASSKSAGSLRRRPRISRKRASRCRAKIVGAVIRPSFRALLMLVVRVSFRRPTISPTSKPNSATCCAISSSTPFTSAAHAAEAPKNAATPALFSMSRCCRMVRSRFQRSSRFRNCPSLYIAMVFAINFRQARESKFAMAHWAVA
mmetsp:Transcript_75725/g.245083  ORF Transcript_75725/g.245083 Transcript_75725/m.245083 type:complete len:457 (-) Transcript_75725:1188-2558(-)